MEKVDLLKESKDLYHASAKKVDVVNVPKMQFLMVNGKGNPNNSSYYQEVVEALYSLSYTLKFTIKKSSLEIDYKVMPLEGLWWAEDMDVFATDGKEDWLWTMMIRQPDFITEKDVAQALLDVGKKKNNSCLNDVYLADYLEGLSVQIMHIGPYSEEGPTIKHVHDFIKEQGLVPTGKHHEIYFGDPRRSAPEKLKTIIRQPVKQL